jgi:hypothetical protein
MIQSVGIDKEKSMRQSVLIDRQAHFPQHEKETLAEFDLQAKQGKLRF